VLDKIMACHGRAPDEQGFRLLSEHVLMAGFLVPSPRLKK